MRNPYAVISKNTNLKTLLNRRLSIIAELTHFDRERLLMWSFVQAVLAACWHVEDGSSGVDVMINAAEVFYSLL